jgi:hypothetical protein
LIYSPNSFGIDKEDIEGTIRDQTFIKCLIIHVSKIWYLSFYSHSLPFGIEIQMIFSITRYIVHVLFSPKGVMRIRQSKKDRQYNGQKKKDKRTNNNLQNITRKTTDRVTQTQLKTAGELRCSGRVSSSCSTCCSHRVPLVIPKEWIRPWLSLRRFTITLSASVFLLGHRIVYIA